MNRICGYPELLFTIGLPHAGQKPRLLVFPLSAFWSWNLSAPLIESASAGTASNEARPVPPAR
jgi:hypothetical protein